MAAQVLLADVALLRKGARTRLPGRAPDAQRRTAELAANGDSALVDAQPFVREGAELAIEPRERARLSDGRRRYGHGLVAGAVGLADPTGRAARIDVERL